VGARCLSFNHWLQCSVVNYQVFISVLIRFQTRLIHSAICLYLLLASSNANIVSRAHVPYDPTFQGLIWVNIYVKKIRHTSAVDMCCFRLAPCTDRKHWWWRGELTGQRECEPLQLNFSKKHNYALQDQLYSLLPRSQLSTLPWLSVYVHSYYKINASINSMV
jgi:hypothetical protein